MTVDLGTLNAGHFEPYLGQTFRFLLPEDRSVLAEVELTTLKQHSEFTPRWAKRTACSMLFEAFGQIDLANGNYLIEHPTEGLIGPLFIVRTIPLNLDRACYELILN